MSFLVGVPGKLKKLLDRLTETRAGYLDYIDTLNSRWTAARAGYVDNVNSKVNRLDTDLTTARCENLDNVLAPHVQRGSFTFGDTETTHTVTLGTALQDTTKAWLIFSVQGDNGISSIDEYCRYFMVGGEIYSTTQLKFYRKSAVAGKPNPIIYWQVIEWK